MSGEKNTNHLFELILNIMLKPTMIKKYSTIKLK